MKNDDLNMLVLTYSARNNQDNYFKLRRVPGRFEDVIFILNNKRLVLYTQFLPLATNYTFKRSLHHVNSGLLLKLSSFMRVNSLTRNFMSHIKKWISRDTTNYYDGQALHNYLRPSVKVKKTNCFCRPCIHRTT